MAFSTINKSTLYQNNVSYTGDGSTQAITGIGFQPDFIWLKSTGTTYNYQTFNPLIGTDYSVTTNESAAKISMSGVTAFGADGFTLGTNSQCNGNTTPYISWNWKAGTTSIPSGGSITPSAVSINTTSGFGTYTYAGVSGSSATIAHGLGVAPDFVIAKDIEASSRSWCVYARPLGATKYLNLDTTTGETDNDNRWYDTDPTSTLITVGDYETNESGSHTFIMYAFAPITGYSKFGGYTGNGNANGTFVYTGFSPNWVMIKETSGSGGWRVFDNLRPAYNDKYGLAVDSDAAQETATDRNKIDQLSNGFKLRMEYDDTNGDGGSYIYAAFGQPIISNGGVCATAR